MKRLFQNKHDDNTGEKMSTWSTADTIMMKNERDIFVDVSLPDIV